MTEAAQAQPLEFRAEVQQLLHILAHSLYTDREIYRPAQTVYFRGIVRAEKDVQYDLPDLPTFSRVEDEAAPIAEILS